jgi:hypothetical protein
LRVTTAATTAGNEQGCKYRNAGQQCEKSFAHDAILYFDKKSLKSVTLEELKRSLE